MALKIANLRKKILKYFNTFLMLICLAPMTLHAQDAPAGGDALLEESLGDVYLVIGTTAAGAILGLSTLSFEEEPKDRLNNIVIGAAIGVILGVGIVAYKAASSGQNTYYDEAYLAPQNKMEYSTRDRQNWHTSTHISLNKVDRHPDITYTFQF